MTTVISAASLVSQFKRDFPTVYSLVHLTVDDLAKKTLDLCKRGEDPDGFYFKRAEYLVALSLKLEGFRYVAKLLKSQEPDVSISKTMVCEAKKKIGFTLKIDELRKALSATRAVGSEDDHTTGAEEERAFHLKGVVHAQPVRGYARQFPGDPALEKMYSKFMQYRLPR